MERVLDVGLPFDVRTRRGVNLLRFWSRYSLLVLVIDRQSVLCRQVPARANAEMANFTELSMRTSILRLGRVRQPSHASLRDEASFAIGGASGLLSTDSRTAFRALARRDITVPTGIDNISEISR